jgi:two-component system cell cycle response regulator
LKILVADDDATSRLIITTAVSNLGHECETVSEGTQAWDAFRLCRPDVVISDWMMPGKSGLELCSSIRSDPSGSYTYFIMVTRHDGREQILEGMGAGADDYLTKPLNAEDLEARLIAAARVTSLHRQLGHQRSELESLNAELAAVARRDPLTGLANRRALDEDLEVLEARVTRYGHRYCMAVLDIDHFKAYNDSCGHQAGDQVLEKVAKVLKADVRIGDSLYRYGGEEFLCIFPEQSVRTAALAVQRMRARLERQAIPHPDSPLDVVTLSAGLAMLEPGDTRSVAEVLKQADDALYRAKKRGRNRVALAHATA